MGMFDSFINAIAQELGNTVRTLKDQAPVMRDALKEEAKIAKAFVAEQAPEIKGAFKEEREQVKNFVKENSPVVKNAFREEKERLKEAFNVSETACDAEENVDAEAESVDLEKEFGEQEPVMKTVEEDSDAMLDDLSYIKDMRHLSNGAWQQYDFLLAARGYGWEYMVDSAEYMTQSDLSQIGTVAVTNADGSTIELIEEYRSNRGTPTQMPTLKNEFSTLGVGGVSNVLGCLTKIVWINQTQTLRIFVFGLEDEDKLKRYAETVIRRTFGTKDAMKQARPCD